MSDTTKFGRAEAEAMMEDFGYSKHSDCRALVLEAYSRGWKDATSSPEATPQPEWEPCRALTRMLHEAAPQVQPVALNRCGCNHWTKPTCPEQNCPWRARAPVAWCALTAAGQIAYFDGKPMVMPGPAGNDCHPVPLVDGRAVETSSEAKRLREALDVAYDVLKLARSSHGNMLLSDPPQEAWKGYRVDEHIARALAAIDSALSATPDPEGDSNAQ